MKISEKMLEDWICEHPEEILGMALLGRQIRLQHGILDILAYRTDIRKISPIELKIKPLKEKDIGQILRYAYDVGRLLNSAWGQLETKNGYCNTGIMTEEYRNIFNRLLDDSPKSYRDDIFERLFYDPIDNNCSPILMGPSIDDMAFAAARGAGIVVFLWEYENGTFRFDLPQNDIFYRVDYLPDWTQWTMRLHIEHTAREAIRVVDEEIDPQLLGI